MVLKNQHRRRFFAVWVLPGVLALFSFHCSTTQPVRVLENGSTRFSASLGGPLIQPAGFPMPLPYLTAGVQHGFTDDVTVFGRTHLTMMLFGDLGLDGGVSTALFRQHGCCPEVTLTGMAYLFSDLRHGRATRAFPSMTVTASYDIGRSILAYFGADDLYQFRPAHHFITPLVGVDFPVSERCGLQAEWKWVAANVNTAHGVFEGYSSIADNGAVGTYIGMTYRW